MNGDQGASAVFYLLLLIIPLGALLARRLPLGRTAIMALAWVGIFATGLVVVSLFQRASWLSSSVSEVVFGPDQSVVGGELRVPMGQDGHFHVRATINGVARDMMVDSGATTIALSTETAKAANINLDESPFPVVLDTANGTTTARRVTIGDLQVGPISAKDIEASASDNLGTQDLLGMNFLSKLKAWRVEGKTLILIPNPK